MSPPRCDCVKVCGDRPPRGDPDDVCAGLPKPPKVPILELVLVPR